MARTEIGLLFAWLAGCGGQWQPGPGPHAEGFLLECGHAATCESCHAVGSPLGAVDAACASCHGDERPASHDPATTGTCEDCHTSACGWDDLDSPHPPGFGEPGAHGLAVNLQDPTEGDCLTCHGADLTGDTAGGCDSCHANEGHADWRTDCVFCHGGTLDASGAPPADIDGETDPSAISFRPHLAHVDADGDYRASPCVDCHADHNDVLTPDHVFDATPGVSEVAFGRGPSDANVWDGNGGCSSTYCHGHGSRDDGAIFDGAGPMDCESCHATTTGHATMSGLHASHLAEPGIVCNDCHAAIVDRSGAVVTAPRHVDGERDVAFFEADVTTTNGGGTCTGSCHGYDHDGVGWGHVPNYEEPGLHGRDSNLQTSDCGSCHGEDWAGGVAQGCDACHASEGHADWRTDCAFCHGGEAGDTEGLPPQDLDDESDEALISFRAHPEHDDPGGIGHPAYDCSECHAVPTAALDPGHAVDGTPAVAEVDLGGGLSWEGGWDHALTGCSNMYCHGDGQSPSGTVSDTASGLTCDDCHATTAGWTAMSGTHDAHLTAGVLCSECHAPVVNDAGAVVTGALHVNRQVDLDQGAIGYDPADATCTITCHGEDHSDFTWSGPHPPGYDAPEQHGQESLHQVQDCGSCHGADLRGGSAVSCDSCHVAGWRSDCTYCHGGAGGDTAGLPPTDLDDQANEALISFKAHPEHADGDIHPLWGCSTCHGAAAGGYSDAPSDPGHWFDSTPGVAEVAFTGDAAGASYAAGNCSNSGCHGNGQVVGDSTDGTTALDCDGCHRYSFDLGDLSGTHSLHLGVAGVSCADCHDPIVDAAGGIRSPARHVDGDIDVDLASTGYDAAANTCTVTCHSHAHNAISWNGGHPAGFEFATAHGQDALFRRQDCATSGCHGTDLLGGASGQGCESCHTVGWRSDCTFCHGGSLGDTDGLPPSDLDDTTNEATISFKAHPEHADGDDHLAYDCAQCHAGSADYVDAFTDPDHWLGATAGVAEVDFSDGLSAGGSYAGTTCSNVYCHGDGQSDGAESDSVNGLLCDACHADEGSSSNAWDQMSGEHKKHLEEGYGCFECHYDVVNSAQAIIGAAQHADGAPDVRMAPANGLSWNGSTCSGGQCHGSGESHNNEGW